MNLLTINYDDVIDILEDLDEEEQKEILANIEDKELIDDIKMIQSYEDNEE